MYEVSMDFKTLRYFGDYFFVISVILETSDHLRFEETESIPDGTYPTAWKSHPFQGGNRTMGGLDLF